MTQEEREEFDRLRARVHNLEKMVLCILACQKDNLAPAGYVTECFRNCVEDLATPYGVEEQFPEGFYTVSVFKGV